MRAEYAAVVGFLAYTGLRWGEMAALRLENFACCDAVRRSRKLSQGVRGKLVWEAPKDHERRSVPFPAFLAQPLAELMEGKGRTDLVFTGAKGAVSAVSRSVRASLRRRSAGRRRPTRHSPQSRLTTCGTRRHRSL